MAPDERMGKGNVIPYDTGEEDIYTLIELNSIRCYSLSVIDEFVKRPYCSLNDHFGAFR